MFKELGEVCFNMNICSWPDIIPCKTDCGFCLYLITQSTLNIDQNMALVLIVNFLSLLPFSDILPDYLQNHSQVGKPCIVNHKRSKTVFSSKLIHAGFPNLGMVLEIIRQ